MPKKAIGSSFWTDQHMWTAAVAEQRKHWGKENNSDRELADAMGGTFDDNTVWKISALYRTARNFPEENRKEFIGALREALENLSNPNFSGIVTLTRSLAGTAKNLSPGSPRPLSGVSKLLWHRLPLHGFIYDSQALNAVIETGLLAPFYDRLDDWGGPPEDRRVVDFLTFAAAYERYFLPLQEPLTEFLNGVGVDSRCAPRIIDKILWLRGLREENRKKAISDAVSSATANDKEVALFAWQQARDYFARLDELQMLHHERLCVAGQG